MKTAIFSTKRYDREFLTEAAAGGDHELVFFEARLLEETCPLAHGYPAVSVFVNDRLDESVMRQLAEGGTRFIVLRCAGFNNVDLHSAARLGIRVARVPAYSPHAVAEHTLALMLALNRKLHKAHPRVREGNFSLDGLLGFDMHRRTAGVVGTGQIGAVVARLLHGFGCRLLLHDVHENDTCRTLGEYVPMDRLLAESDIITLHCPLVPQTEHLIDAAAVGRMRRGAMLINTSRGGLVDTRAVISGLKSGQIGYLGLDVYEEEAELFFEDLSGKVIQDDVFSRLLTFPNVIITGHQAFFTAEALRQIAQTTITNLTEMENGAQLSNEVSAERLQAT